MDLQLLSKNRTVKGSRTQRAQSKLRIGDTVADMVRQNSGYFCGRRTCPRPLSFWSTAFLTATIIVTATNAQLAEQGEGEEFIPSISAVKLMQDTSQLEAGQDFTVNWEYDAGSVTAGGGSQATTGDLTAFEFDMVKCSGDSSSSCDSSSSVCSGNVGGSPDINPIELCLRESGFCLDSDGSYDLTVPASDNSGATTVGNFYMLRVRLAADNTVSGCTDEGFQVVAGSAAVVVVIEGDDDEVLSGIIPPTIKVLEPVRGLIPGDVFTAKWLYDETGDGLGDAGNFAVDLYSCDDGACGDNRCVR